MRGKSLTLGGAVGLALLLGSPAAAVDLFRADISVGGGPVTARGTNSIRKLPDFFTDSALMSIEPGYDGSQAVLAGVDVRGLAATLRYDAGVNTLFFEVPGAGIDTSFTGGSRAATLDAFEEWLEGDAGTTQLLQGLVAHSPVDPVAGNPNSLQSRMFAQDWRMGTTGAVDAVGEGGLLPSFFGVDIAGGIYDADGFDVYTIDVPLQFRVGLGDMFGVIFDLPATFTSTNGAWTGMGQAGLGIKVQPIANWTITPAARFGFVGSVDLGGLALMTSGSITSHLRFPVGPVTLGIANMGGVARTIDGIEVSGYSLDYDLTNWAMRHGGYVEAALSADLLGTGLAVRFEASDVRFFGDELFLESYQEMVASAAAGLPFGGIRLGLAYLVGKNYDGVSLRLGLRF